MSKPAPAPPVKTTDIRTRARAYLNAIPASVHSEDQSKMFFHYTRVLHSKLVEKWKAGNGETTCNAFTGVYGTNLGSKVYLGTFWPWEPLKAAGKGHAWVPSDQGCLPGFGDIFIVNRWNEDAKRNDLHSGIVLECNGATWSTIESGQGGPLKMYDLIKRKSGPFDRTRIKGWIDIQGLEQGPAAAQETGDLHVPDWLVGWWAVQWRDSTYYYSFDGKNGVGYSKEGPGKRPKVFGKAVPAANNGVSIFWAGTGTNERFESAGEGVMRGRWNNVEPLYAKFLGR